MEKIKTAETEKEEKTFKKKVEVRPQYRFHP